MDLVAKIQTVIIQPIIIFLFALAVVTFLYGVAEYLLGSDNEEQRQKGATHMLWGIIGIAIMTMASGILVVIQNTLLAGA